MDTNQNIRPKMLIVDDEEVNRAILSSIFESKFDIIEAASGEEAISAIQSEPLAIILLDIIMPGLSGYDVLIFLKKKGYLQKFPAVVISGLDDVQSRGRLYDLGASDIITKPFVPEVVVQHVGSVLEYFGKMEKSKTEERKTILIADDTLMNRAIIAEIFFKDYEVLEAGDGQEAIEILVQESEKIAAVILDVMMPRKSGFEVIEFMRDKNYLEDIPVVFITAMEKPENELRIWNLGASDVISKPFLPHIVKKRVENVIHLYNNKRHMAFMLEYQERKQDFFNNELVDVLSSLIEYRSLESGKHIMRIRIYSKILLTKLVEVSPDYFMDKETILTIADATAMHDIGKIVIPDVVLNKAGRLTKEEFEVIQQHPAVGSQILSRLLGSDMNEYMRYAYDICRYHHERFDGKGYPDGLYGNEIPIWAQIAGIADVYDALTTDRVYKPAFSHEEAIRMMVAGECGTFSPLLLSCLKSVEDEFAKAAKKYRDGLSPRAEQFVSMPHKSAKMAKSRSAQAAMYKYFAMLQLTGGTTYEFNINTGEYQLVYPLAVSGNILKESGNLFEDMHEAALTYIHADDREMMNQSIVEWQERIRAGLIAPEPMVCRVYQVKEAEYHWFRISYKAVVGEIDGNNFALVQMHDMGGIEILQKKSNRMNSRIAMLLPILEGDWQETAPDGIIEYLSRFGDGFVEYDLENSIGTYYYAGKKSVYPLIKGKDYILDFVHSDDTREYKEHLSRLLRGNEVEDIQFSMSTGGDDYRRKWKRSVLVRDGFGNPTKVYSSIVEADRLLCHVDDIKIKSQMDLMTGALNKTMTEYSITQLLASSDPENDTHSMLIIDIDDFKMVNDTFGHLMGDGVINSVCGKLRTVFSSTDIIGRIGGDEFMVLVKNDADEKILSKRLQNMFNHLSEIRLKNNMTISISVGVARYPRDGVTYTEMFENADKALYQAKTSGKGRYYLAEESMKTIADMQSKVTRTRIESEVDADKGFHDMFSHMLMEMDDSKQAIESIFDYTARTLSLNSIMAVDRSDNVLFEWQADTSYKPYCRLGTAISKLDYSSGVENLDGVVICSDIDNLDPIVTADFKEEGVGAFIYAQTDTKYFKQGYLIFVSKEKGRQWRSDEIKIVKIIAKMFSLLRAKAFAEMQNRDSQMLMNALFDSGNEYYYVIDEKFRILYANNRVNGIVKKCEGGLCYAVFNSRTSPCENCPVLDLNTKDKATAFIHLRKLGHTAKVCAQTGRGEGDKKLIIITLFPDEKPPVAKKIKRKKAID